MNTSKAPKRYLLASDFDQTLSFNDTGAVLSEMLGIRGFGERVQGLSSQNFVQQGAELSYLIRHDPDFRVVRKEHLVEAGKRIRLKHNVGALEQVLNDISPEHHFYFAVISASPQEVIQSALDGIVAPEQISGTRFAYDSRGEVQSILHCPAGYGKVAVINELIDRHQINRHRVIYVGDGCSDVNVMLHVNHLKGLTVAVSRNKHIATVARRIMLSDDVLAVVVPVLEELLHQSPQEILELFDGHGYHIQEWDKLSTDALVIR